jgi:uncharacterized integral membrane protein
MGKRDDSGEKSASRRVTARQVGWFVVATVAILFVVLNSDRAEVNLVAASPKWPLWTLVVASMAIGFLLAKLTGRRRRDD